MSSINDLKTNPEIHNERFEPGDESLDGTQVPLYFCLFGANDALTRGQAIEVHDVEPPVIYVWDLSSRTVVEQRPFSMKTLSHLVDKYVKIDKEISKE